MIVWINGPFGAGKTTLAEALVVEHPDWAIFDPEEIGFALRRPLAKLRPVSNFQDWPLWRDLVITALAMLDRSLRTVIIVPQTVVSEAYWTELMDGLELQHVEVASVTLHVDEAEHERRIKMDLVEPGAAAWRRDRRPRYEEAMRWLSEQGTMIDTTALSVGQVADRVLALLDSTLSIRKRYSSSQ